MNDRANQQRENSKQAACTLQPIVHTIKCPHGRTMYSDRTENGIRRVHGGTPACCFDMLCTPAAGESFVILERGGRQKRIHNGLMGVSLVGANSVLSVTTHSKEGS
jgi:hypothetical protein